MHGTKCDNSAYNSCKFFSARFAHRLLMATYLTTFEFVVPRHPCLPVKLH